MGGSFSSLRAYGVALLETPKRLVQRMGAVSSCKEELTQVKARSGAEMQRSLRWFDLIAMGIGGMVGAGVFVSTGKAARNLAGPSIIVSYIIAGVSALLSALCYTEFAVALPAAGGAFSYLITTFGNSCSFLILVSFFLYTKERIAQLRVFLCRGIPSVYYRRKSDNGICRFQCCCCAKLYFVFWLCNWFRECR